jgi:hypothetical protein
MDARKSKPRRSSAFAVIAAGSVGLLVLGALPLASGRFVQILTIKKMVSPQRRRWTIRIR